MSKNFRRPFWLPTGSYYFLAVAIALVMFFIIWWFLDDGKGKSPWVPAGFVASVILVGAGLFREIVLRKAMNRYLSVRRQLEQNLNRASQTTNQNLNFKNTKLTLRQNKVMLEDIEQKSKAARALKQLPDVHLEVFEICEAYLKKTAKELDKIQVNSPRFGAVQRGRQRVKNLHKYHLLSWASVESHIYTQEANEVDSFEKKVVAFEKAQNILKTALDFYPNEKQLIESYDVVKEFRSSAKLSSKIQKAEEAVFEKEYKSAIIHYKDALFYLAREDFEGENKEVLAEKINTKIKKLREKTEKKFEKNKIIHDSDDLEVIE